ncbi:helix-turn-helix domain-containing protein [Azospirillum rugosum]|uniref:Cytoskeletal protein RodZ n=1 Tax=Azospirillum rugosum TaxID=416170 RepID=A0ABS4SGY5_9PROT|nr:helix-turn-helix domain-containing protein [Azospirillum rugosum]MBP2291834.1 cytoskeletal protein RodZ [Azospirillum rugosum]MDQ0524354.1 cytoskeletal protein RodZ [Azospirillum rugosum]
MMGKRKVLDTLDPASQFGSLPAGPSVSDTLRETRESLGYDLREVATMLRIRYPYLQAIESGRFDELPGAAYAAGFLRSYAECLGLDPEAIITRYKDEAAGKTRSQQLYFPTPVPEGRIPGGTVLLGTMVLAGIVYGGWYYLSATDRSMVDLVPTLPDRLVSLLDTSPLNNVPGSAQAPAPTDTAPPVPNMTAEAPTTPPSAGGASTPAPVPTGPVAAPVAPTPAAPAVQSAPAPTPAPAKVANAPAAAPQPAAPAPIAPAPTAPPPAPAAALPAPTPGVKPSVVAAIPPAAVPAVPAAPAGMVSVPPPPSEDEEGEGTAQEPTPLSPGAPAIAGLPPAPPPAPARAATDTAGLPSKVYGSQNPTSRIQLRATQDSWIQVRDGNGEIIFTRVLKPGDVYRVPDRAGIRVRTGNAGGLTMVTDGVDGAPLGAVGQVLRDVALDQGGAPPRTGSAR